MGLIQAHLYPTRILAQEFLRTLISPYDPREPAFG
jgi:hypothetical protein